MINVGVVIVTHNSSSVLPVCLSRLQAQRLKVFKIIVVDSGSQDEAYLQLHKHCIDELVLIGENIGFSRANNIGYSLIKGEVDWVLFINPDTFLPPEWMGNATQCVETMGAGKVGCLSGPLLGYDSQLNAPSGLIDSLGIYRTRLGFWKDKGGGKELSEYSLPSTDYLVEAVCGALMLCPVSALEEVSEEGKVPFNELYFMYKEDIELSWRLKDKGWQLIISPQLQSYHCRGWNSDRGNMSLLSRKASAINELRLCLTMRSPFVLLACMKLCWVCLYER